MTVRMRLVLLLALVASGCTQNPFQPGQRGAFWRQPKDQPAYMAQLQELDERSRKLDANNADLQTELAQQRQQLQLMQQELRVKNKQLEETANQLESMLAAKQQAEQKVETLQASMQRRGSATITANNSLKQPLTAINIPGLDVRRDGDVLRVSIPADSLFAPGDFQLTERADLILNQVAQAIRENYPQQRIVIESHTDATTVRGDIKSPYQLSASQSLSVFQFFTEDARLPRQQFLTMNYGPNEPQVSNGTAAGAARNRRIEIVIYPETVR